MKTFIVPTDFTHSIAIKKLIGKFGMEGYGRFMVLQELFARADNEEINLSLSELNTLLHTKTKTLKPFLNHCQNILITFPEHSENIPETLWEHSENILIMKPIKLLKSGDDQNSSLTSLTSNLTVNSNLTSLVKTTDKERQNKKDEPKLPYLDPTKIDWI